MPPKHLTLAVLFFAAFAHSSDNTVTYGGQTYKTVKIGEQTWMAENLNYEAEGSVCYDNNPANCAKYGRLYNWKTALAVCPTGSHLPDTTEWQTLVNYAGGRDKAGTKLKSTSGWDEGGNGTNNYGFSALPGGGKMYYGDDDFSEVGKNGSWWSATEYDADYAWLWNMHFLLNNVNFGGDGNDKNDLLSVRCVLNTK